MNELVITVCATKSFCYAMKTLGRRVAANLYTAGWTDPGTAIIAGDDSPELGQAVKSWIASLPKNWEVRKLIVGTEDPALALYKEQAQVFLAKLRTAAFTEARRLNPKYCWSLDSDTLPHDNALRCMIDMLRFDDGYYSVSTCPYPNDLFLGGRGTQFNQIAQDFLEKERVVPDELKAASIALKAEADQLDKEAKETLPGTRSEPPKEWIDRKKAWEDKMREHDEKLRSCPPDGHIWEVIGKYGWRQRGWLDHAYPSIGLGSVVPSDWCGFGCTLMKSRPLSLCNFEAYDGKGTEDLWVVWRHWWPAGIKINAITHCPCDHVLAAKKRDPKGTTPTLLRSYHETQGEAIGHLRIERTPWPKED